MKRCVYLDTYDYKEVCGHPDSDYCQTPCPGKCDLFLSAEEACPYLDRCGHGGSNRLGCKKDVYCSYRNIRFK